MVTKTALDFFFFDSEYTAIKTAEIALKKTCQDSFWLTHAKIICPIRLLDLRGGSTYVILNTLYCEGLDIFDSSMTIYALHGSSKFKTVKHIFFSVTGRK